MLILGILFMLIPIAFEGVIALVFMFFGLFIALASYVMFFVFWRCSYCKKILPMNGSIGITHCPYCGTELE